MGGDCRTSISQASTPIGNSRLITIDDYIVDLSSHEEEKIQP